MCRILAADFSYALGLPIRFRVGGHSPGLAAASGRASCCNSLTLVTSLPKKAFYFSSLAGANWRVTVTAAPLGTHHVHSLACASLIPFASARCFSAAALPPLLRFLFVLLDFPHRHLLRQLPLLHLRASLQPAHDGMTAIELSHRQWLEQGVLLASEKKFLQSEVAARGRAPSHEPTIALRHYEEGRLGYSLTQHPAAQFERSKTSGGSPPLQRRDVLRSNGSMFFCTEADGSGLPHAEAKLASFKKKYEQLSLERAFPDKYAVRETRIQERVKTALREIVHVEESKRNGQREENVELMQVCSRATQPPAAAHCH